MNKSFTIIELMVAVFVLLVGILAAFSLVSSALSYSSAYKLQLTAAYLAQEGIEIVRNIRDTNWIEGGAETWNSDLEIGNWEADYTTNSFTNNYGNNPYNRHYYNDSNPNYLKILQTGTKFYNYTSGVDTSFKRSINLSSSTADEILITVTISWSERGRNHTFEVKEKIYNWR